jgi:hypothetical protein
MACESDPNPKTRLEHNTAAAAINLIRLDARWTGKPLDRTRTTHLQRLDLAALKPEIRAPISQQGPEWPPRSVRVIRFFSLTWWDVLDLNQ